MVRLVIYASLVAISHGISLSFFIFLSSRVDTGTLATIGLFESSIFLVIGIVSFGVVQLASREVVSGKPLNVVVNSFQPIRLTLGLIVALMGLVIFIGTGANKWLMFLLAPVFALNVDHLLYAVGKPTVAGIISLVRQGIPYIVLMIAVTLGGDGGLELWFFLVTAFGYLMAGILSSFVLKIKYFHLPSLVLANNFQSVLVVGVSAFVFNSMRSSLPLISSFVLRPEQVVVIYGFFKVLMVFVGVKRMLVQFFYSKVTNPKVANAVDWGVRVVAVLFFAMCLILRKQLSLLYLGDLVDDPNGLTIIVYAAVLLLMSIYTTSEVRLIQCRCEDDFMRYVLFSSGLFFVLLFGGYKINFTPFAFLLMFGFYELLLGLLAETRVKRYLKENG